MVDNNSYTRGGRREANAVYENSKGSCWEALIAEIGGIKKSEESLSVTEVLVSRHLFSLNAVMFADYGNPNTEFSYTQDWIEEALMYGVYENSWRSCRQTWPEKMAALA